MPNGRATPGNMFPPFSVPMLYSESARFEIKATVPYRDFDKLRLSSMASGKRGSGEDHGEER
ncbi:MAG: hypothetical protein Q9165_007805 [Trypethelium subeluteriae]